MTVSQESKRTYQHGTLVICPSDDVRSVVADHLPIPIEYGPIAMFFPYHCVYLEVRPTDRLKALQKAVYRLDRFNRALPFSDPEEFISHIPHEHYRRPSPRGTVRSDPRKSAGTRADWKV